MSQLPPHPPPTERGRTTQIVRGGHCTPDPAVGPSLTPTRPKALLRLEDP